MKISYHAWKAFTECPKKFSLQYVEKAKPTVPQNEYFTLYGRLIEKFFELYCNQWRFKTPYLFPDVIRERLEKLWPDILSSSIINWSAPGCTKTSDQIFEQVFSDVCTIMESQTLNYFLGTTAEVLIELKLNNNHVISGRLDFVHKSWNDLVTIFDGKGSLSKDKFVDYNQLYFYALLYFVHFKKLADELGFFYYRYNCFEQVPLNTDILNEFRARLSLDIKNIDAGKFTTATPSTKSCKFCGWLNTCPEGLKLKALRVKKSKLDLETDGNIIEFSF